MKKRFHIFLILIILFTVFIVSLAFFLFTVDLLVNQTMERGMTDINQVFSDLKKIDLDSDTGVNDDEEVFISSDYPADFQKVAIEQSQITSAHIIIVDTTSRLLADSHRDYNDISGKYITAGLSDARLEGTGSRTLRTSPDRELSVSVAKKYEYGSGEIIISHMYRIDQVSRILYAYLIFITTFILLFGILVFLLVSFSLKQYRKPIKKLLRDTKGAAQGGFNKITVDTTSTELGQLVKNFNTLVDKYNLLVESDNRKYSRINTLLVNLNSGILMVDTGNNVTLVNPQAEKLLDLNKLKLFRDKDESAVQNKIISRILKETRRVNRDQNHCNFSLTGSDDLIIDIHIQAIFNKYIPYEHSGALVILKDVTEMRRLEKLKDDFVSNVSHEFRTPLTVISGFIETLKSWNLLSTEDKDTALNIIEVETERLKKLISELLLLSRIEGKMSESRRKAFSPAKIAMEVITALQPLCNEKSITARVDIDPDISNFFGIESWFRQIIFNIVDNAIKYSPRDGLVGILLNELNGNLILEVSDSGPGIPDEKLERIFDRFYRLDKSRNSKISGSGIGLSIVRNMVKEFDGEIDIESMIGQGSVFRITLPINNETEL